VLAKIREYDPNVAYCIAQVASFERGFFEETADLNYAEAAAFKPDIVIMFYGANVSRDYDTMENPPRTFGDSFEEMRNLLSNDGKAKVYISEGFYIRPVLDAEKKAVAEKYGDTFIEDISDWINDLYLESSGSGGIVSYSRVVHLVLAYNEKNK
jgi:hypothetical protein